MSKMKISNSELRLIIMLLAIILLALAYYFGFYRLNQASQVIELQNDTDRITVNDLEAMVDRSPIVQQETEEMKANIESIIAKYPSDLTTEKAIYLINSMENYSGAESLQNQFVMDNLVMMFQNPREGQEAVPMGRYAAVTVNYVVNYAGFKQMLQYIEAMPDRTTPSLVSATYDPELDMLTGSITMNMYYLTNTGKEYQVPPVEGIEPKGVDSIFGAGEGIDVNAAAAEETPEEGAEE